MAAVREGMARVVPVPLLSLFTGYELETMVSISVLLPLSKLICVLHLRLINPNLNNKPHM